MVLYPTINLSAKFAKLSNNHEKDRNSLSKIVIDAFAREKAGHGKGDDTSKYKYIVETLSSGNRMYLTRPAVLSKGFDFIIHIENHVFVNGKDNSKHEDILNDLKKKKKDNEKIYRTLLKAIDKVFYCSEPDEVYHRYEGTLKG